MLQNAYFLAKIGADTAENEQHFAEILSIGRRVAGRLAGGGARLPPRGAGARLRPRLRRLGRGRPPAAMLTNDSSSPKRSY